MALGLLAVVAAAAVLVLATFGGRWAGGALYERYTAEGRKERTLRRYEERTRRTARLARARFERILPPLQVEVEVDETDTHWYGHVETATTTGHVADGEYVEALRILRGGRLDMPAEEYVVTSRASVPTVRALMQRPGAYERTQAAAALYLAAKGVTRHTLVEDRYLEAARDYRRSLEQWPMRYTALATSGEVRANVDHLLQLLDPVLRETYAGIAPGWNGNVDTAIEAARCVLAE